jgi:hydroxymethylpyrimidine pyrophosphatase-like HAD family hydrolase
MHNRWRETELSVSRPVPEEYLRRVAADHDRTVVGSGYAYHVKSPDVSKATGLRRAADLLDVDPDSFVAIGDSANDTELFDAAGRSYAVVNADDNARERADTVTSRSFSDGLLEALDTLP